jgi:hypothetical protein
MPGKPGFDSMGTIRGGATMEQRVEDFFAMGAREGLWSSTRACRFYIRHLFDGVTLAGKAVLDIGGGKGQYSLYAACAGAVRAVCLEPESAGSSAGMQDAFRTIAAKLDAERASMLPITFQHYQPGPDKYDVILLHNSINHLDEEACIGLHQDARARDTYAAMFRRMHGMMNDSGWLIMADCTRHNFFNCLGLKSPLMPTIEWHKHQPPQLWARLLEETGFGEPRVTWTSINRMGELGRLFLGNRYAAFFLLSHFRLAVRKAAR